MALMHPAHVDTRSFSVDKARKVMTVEASTIRLNREFGFGQVYDDACDVGLTIVSHVTGARIIFVIDHVDVSRPGTEDEEIAGWWLVPAQYQKHDLNGWKLLIIND